MTAAKKKITVTDGDEANIPAKVKKPAKKPAAKKKASTKKAPAKKATRKKPAAPTRTTKKTEPKKVAKKVAPAVSDKEISKEEENIKVTVKSTKPAKETTGIKKAGAKEIFVAVEEEKESESLSPEIQKKMQTSVQEKGQTVVQELKAAESKVAPEETLPEEEPVIKSRPVGLYKKFAFTFILLTVLLLAVIGYFTFVKVDIILIPNQERISNNLIFDIYDKDIGQSENSTAIAGVVKEITIDLSENYPTTGSEVIGEETVGIVTITNNYIKNQPLVATTRLLSPDDKLFRIKNTINVPAGGSVQVEVYADEPGEDMAIQPTTFTIPGLWAGLQDKIYGQSHEAFNYQQKKKMSVVQEDIDAGLRDIKQKLLTKAKTEINKSYSEYEQIIYSVNENSIDYTIDAEVGEEREEFPITIEANVIVVAFGDKTAAELAKQKFSSALSSNKEIISFDEDNILYALHESDPDKGVASVNATFEGKVSLKEYEEVVDINKILGLNSKQLEAYLSGLPEIAGYEIKFFPSFIKKVPRLSDRVNIELRK
jgi:hypothetical protein